MRLHILSDLHLEFGSFEIPETDADVLVLAGDIHSHTHGVRWAASIAHGRPTIYVPGNHEYYHSHLNGLAQEMRKRADELGVHLLDNDEVVIGNVRFLGTTLWTDFALYGTGPVSVQAMQLADSCMSDFRLIRYASRRLFTARDSARLHHAAVQWLVNRLASPHSGPTVIISHHCPHPQSIADRFKGDALNPAFCSNLSTGLVEWQPELWVHGHTHDSFDYQIGETRIVCNPRGYIGRDLNRQFLPDFMIDLPTFAHKRR